MAEITIPKVTRVARKKFDELYKSLELPRCRRINKSAFNKASETHQLMCFQWLKSIHDTKYQELRRHIGIIPQERWALYARVGYNDLEEVRIRKQLEQELRDLWEMTMPNLLRRLKCDEQSINDEQQN